MCNSLTLLFVILTLVNACIYQYIETNTLVFCAVHLKITLYTIINVTEVLPFGFKSQMLWENIINTDQHLSFEAEQTVSKFFLYILSEYSSEYNGI